MTDLEIFQRDHGDQWNSIIEHPSFGAAMQFLNARKINEVSQLSDEDIEAKGKLILADLRGHLNHENDLMRLSVMKSLVFGAPPPESYADPVTEINAAPQSPTPLDPPVIHTQPPKPRKKRK